MAKRKKSFFEMTPAEREQDVAKFDKPLPDTAFKPLSAKEQALLARMKQGKQEVVIKLDAKLVSELDSIAKKKRLTRSELIEQGLRGLLALSA